MTEHPAAPTTAEGEIEDWLRYYRRLRDDGHLTPHGQGALMAMEKWIPMARAAARKEVLDEIRSGSVVWDTNHGKEIRLPLSLLDSLSTDTREEPT